MPRAWQAISKSAMNSEPPSTLMARTAKGIRSARVAVEDHEKPLSALEDDELGPALDQSEAVGTDPQRVLSQGRHDLAGLVRYESVSGRQAHAVGHQVAK
jgi:hypothetical protein